MAVQSERDFASLLDELIAEHRDDRSEIVPPPMSLDYLAVADELHSGRITIARDAAAAEYLKAGGPADESVRPAPPIDSAEADPAPLPVDRDSVARELGLAGKDVPADLDAARRAFALVNHPDRVAPVDRERAMLRMQVANMLIDEAKRGALKRPSRAKSSRT